MVFCFSQVSHAYLLFTGLDDVLSRLEQVEQRPSRALPRLGDTTDTSGDESDIGEPRLRLRSKKTYKMRKAWGRVMLGNFLWLGPQMFWQCPVIFIAEFVEKTCRCWLMVTMRFWGNFRAANTFHATNVWGWRHQAEKCWITRGTPLVQQKLSASERG